MGLHAQLRWSGAFLRFYEISDGDNGYVLDELLDVKRSVGAIYIFRIYSYLSRGEP